jgi:hypothetical protein
MPLTNAGAVVAASLMHGFTDVAPYDQAHTYIGVGDGSAAFAATQTDLQGVDKSRRPLDSAPIKTGNSVDLTATFGLGDANFDWDEIAAFNDPAAGVMLSRKVISLGTKPNNEQWTVTLTVVYSAA